MGRPFFPDVEASLVAYLTAATGVTASVETPSNLEKLPGFIRLIRGPGADDGFTDAPSIDVEAFAPTRQEARALAESVRAAMLDLAGHRAGEVLFDTVRTAVGPYWLDYRNRLVHRVIASYVVTYRAA